MPFTPSPASHRGTVTGILLIVATVLCFACMDGMAKWLGRRITPWEVIAVRYVVAFVAVGAFFNPRTRPTLLQTTRFKLQCLRGVCLVISTAAGWTAVRYISLTKLTSITFSSPLIVALLAGPFLGEKIGPRRVAAVLIGFGGVLVVTRPFGGSTHPAAIFAVVAACSNAVISLITRRLAAHDPAETTMFYTGLVGCLVMAPVVPFVWQTPPSAEVWTFLILLGLTGGLAHWLLILAHRYAPATTLAPFYYLQIVGAVTVGWLAFGELPDRWTVLGTAIVAASGLYLFSRERAHRAHPSVDVPA
jgi:drug/metabolite transporter (DMT)-like permease